MKNDDGPGFWMNETSVLRPAVEAYLSGVRLSQMQIAAIRAYLRQWIFGEDWAGGPGVEALRRGIEGLDCRAAIDDWLADALELGIDPL